MFVFSKYAQRAVLKITLNLIFGNFTIKIYLPSPTLIV